MFQIVLFCIGSFQLWIHCLSVQTAIWHSFMFFLKKKKRGAIIVSFLRPSSCPPIFYWGVNGDLTWKISSFLSQVFVETFILSFTEIVQGPMGWSYVLNPESGLFAFVEWENQEGNPLFGARPALRI